MSGRLNSQKPTPAQHTHTKICLNNAHWSNVGLCSALCCVSCPTEQRQYVLDIRRTWCSIAAKPERKKVAHERNNFTWILCGLTIRSPMSLALDGSVGRVGSSASWKRSAGWNSKTFDASSHSRANTLTKRNKIEKKYYISQSESTLTFYQSTYAIKKFNEILPKNTLNFLWRSKKKAAEQWWWRRRRRRQQQQHLVFIVLVLNEAINFISLP